MPLLVGEADDVTLVPPVGTYPVFSALPISRRRKVLHTYESVLPTIDVPMC